MSTEPVSMRPFAVMAYISGFGNRREPMLHIERKWKDRIEELKRLNNMDPRLWAKTGQSTIRNLETNRFDADGNELKLVLLFTYQGPNIN